MNYSHFINVTKKVYQLACNRQTSNSVEAIQQLENYMYQLTFDEIKFIQTIMYLGRDTTDEERLKYSNRELFESQKRYLERKSWSKRELEADHIIAKTPLDEYLQKGLEIVKNLDTQLSCDNNNLNIENEQTHVKNQKEANFMSQYYKIEVVSARFVNSYLEKGWVLIDTTRELSSYGEISVSYHMGYPINSYIADLKGIIDKYEELELFEELKKRLCEKEGLDPQGLREESFYLGNHPKNETVNFLNNYVNVLKNKNGNYIYVDPSSEKKEESNIKETAVTVDEDDLPF
ncbi:hypothetical protein B1B04_05340 [Lysinibacillus sp. KCTC 33748]|uniref:DUF3775 domain-containing protein n=1 Tax=unclassified Lysinibacillus TaxID=2636778 RepID=UPI0009A701B1|nr:MULTISPECIES: DUF3775 domain-containing protein [unclassified Lysinibacillus]OXS76398.1 hypothetical protein B1B04_05340 [Lysinibacillus sp. KCTC 33748]SKB45343.1 Protein of unknown function [Lysinibacillus sp. AC-3]